MDNDLDTPSRKHFDLSSIFVWSILVLVILFIRRLIYQESSLFNLNDDGFSVLSQKSRYIDTVIHISSQLPAERLCHTIWIQSSSQLNPDIVSQTRQTSYFQCFARLIIWYFRSFRMIFLFMNYPILPLIVKPKYFFSQKCEKISKLVLHFPKTLI